MRTTEIKPYCPPVESHHTETCKLVLSVESCHAETCKLVLSVESRHAETCKLVLSVESRHADTCKLVLSVESRHAETCKLVLSVESRHAETCKPVLSRLRCQAPGDLGSALELVSPLSVYCNWIRQRSNLKILFQRDSMIKQIYS